MSSNFYALNLESLKRKDPHLARRVDEAPPEGEIASARSSSLTITCEGLRLHSAYDPVKEAERALREHKKIEEAELVLCSGFALGYTPEAVLKKINKRAVMIVVEKRLGLFKKAMESRYLLELFSDARVRFVVGVEEASLFNALADRFPMECSASIAVAVSPFTMELDAGYYKQALRDFSRVQRLHLQTIKTMDGFAEEWTGNILKNLPQIARAGGVADLIRALKKDRRPAVVIGAGPSLRKALPLLKKNHDRALLLAVDTALPVLTAGGIVPHLVFSFDSQKETLIHFKNARTEELAIVFSVFSPPELVKRPWKGSFFSIPEDAVGEWVQSVAGSKGTLRQGGTVSSVAFDFARQSNCDPIIFVGQDFSFEERTHADGSAYESKTLSAVGRFQSMESFLRVQHQGAVPASDIHDRPVLTWPNMLKYAEWFSEECKTTSARCINATGAGILKDGVEIADLSEIMPSLSSLSLDADLFVPRRSGTMNVFFIEDLLRTCRSFLEFSGDVKNAVEGMEAYPIFSYLAKSLPILYRGAWDGDAALEAALREKTQKRLAFIRSLCPLLEEMCELS